MDLSGCIRTSRKGKDPSGEGCSMVKERSIIQESCNEQQLHSTAVEFEAIFRVISC